MNNPEQLASTIDEILKQLEQVLRGHQKSITSDSNDLHNASYFVYEYVSSSLAAPQLCEASIPLRSQIMDLSIKLHNKCRNITMNQYLEIRTVLKASSAYIFSYLGGKSAKVHSTVLKLFSKCGEEFSQLCNNERLADICFKEVEHLWKVIEENSLCEELPPIEVQEIRIGVFHSLVGKIRMSMNKEPDVKQLKQFIAPAMDLCRSIPLKHKLLFIDTLLHIGSAAADNKDTRNEALSFYRTGIELLEQSDKNVNDNEENSMHLGTLIQLKAKAYLAMILTYCEMNEPEKAKLYVDMIAQIESKSLNALALAPFESPILYAKFFVSAKLLDFPTAEKYLKELIKCTQTTFDTSLNAVRFVLDLAPDDETKATRISDCFKLLAVRFPKEPEFTSIRVAHLQSIMLQSDSQQSDQKSHEIAMRILTDHLHQINILDKENFKLFRNLLLEKVRQLDTSQQWNGVRSWADLLIPLTDAKEEEIGTNITAMLTKVVAAIHLRLFTEAIGTAQRAIQKKVTSKALVALFHALLCSEDIPAEEVIHRILNNQEKYVVNTSFPASLAEDRLNQLLLCLGFAHFKKNEISPLRHHQISYLLIRVLLEKYEQVKPWRYGSDRITKSTAGLDSDFQDPIDYEKRFYELACIYFNHYFIDLKMQLVLLQRQIDTTTTHDANILSSCSMDVVEFFVDCGKSIKVLSALIKSLKEEFMKKFQSIVRNIVDNVQVTKDIYKLGNQKELAWMMIAANVVINALFHLENTIVLNAAEVNEEDDERIKALLSAAKRNSQLVKYYYDNASDNLEEAGILKLSINLLYAELNALMAELYRSLPPPMLAFLSTYSAEKNSFEDEIVDCPKLKQKEESAEVQQARCFIVASGGYLDAVEVFKRHLLNDTLSANSLWKELYGDALEKSTSIDMDMEEDKMDEESKFSGDILQQIASRHHSLEIEALTKFWKNKINTANEWCTTAKAVLTTNIDFATPLEKDLYSKSILLQIGCFCAMGDNSKSDAFIRSMESELKELQIPEFKVAVQLAKSTEAFSIEAMRFLLQQGVAYCKKCQPVTAVKEYRHDDDSMEITTTTTTREEDEQENATEEIPIKTSKDMDIPLTILWMYRNLIEISASRRQAFDFFVEIENYLLCLFRARYSCAMDSESEKKLKASFLPDKTEIDTIISTGHNYTCTLIELDQIPLAELFLVKLLHLLPFASDITNNMSSRLKETYDFIAKRKETCGGGIGTTEYRVEDFVQPFPIHLLRNIMRPMH